MIAEVYLSSILAFTVCVSAIVLSIQRGIYHKRQPIALPTEPVKKDHLRDVTVPFSDSNRITRITYCTLLLTAMSAFQLHDSFRHVDVNSNSQQVYVIVSTAIVFVCWLYVSVIALSARQYVLPNVWGWVMNVHLCIIYTVAWLYSICQFWQEVVIGSPEMAWIQCLLYLLPVLFGLDLIYVTATTKQGPSFLDDQKHQVCDMNNDSIIGILYLSWATQVVRIVSNKKGQVQDQDLPRLDPNFRAHNAYYIFGASRGKGSLFYRLWEANRSAIITQVLLAISAAGLFYAPAFFLNRLLQFFQDVSEGVHYDQPMMHGSLLVLGMGVSIVILGIISIQSYYYMTCVLQTRVRTMLNVELYRKSLRRRDLLVATAEKKEGDGEVEEKNVTEDEATFSSGAVVNLMGTDATRIAEFAALWVAIVSAPLEWIIGFYFLYQIMGISCLFGLLVMVIVLPINHFNARIFAKTQDRLMEARDKRVSLMNEVLQGIRQIKFFAWESKWEARINEARNTELRQLGVTYINGVFFSLVWQGCPILITLLTFYSFTVLEGKELTAPIAFTVISVFAELRYALNVIPETIINALQAYASLKRIQKFLDEDEIESVDNQVSQDVIHIGFENATIGWKRPSTTENSEEDTSFILKDLNAHFPNNELSLVSGATGSGKTLMLLGLLGEAVLINGFVSCPRTPISDDIYSEFSPVSKKIDPKDWILERSLAFVSQQPWLQNTSIRDNILFGLPYIHTRYQETLTACALDRDLSILEDGDMTEVGEKGITLSGGQKARVSLARAVYSRAKNVLMDDVLSAVDAHTAKHLYEALMGPLMKDRTRILVTHHIKLCVKGCAYLVHIDGGRATLLGSPAELRQSGQLAKIIEEDNECKDDTDAAGEDAIDEINTVASYAVEDSQKTARILVEEEGRASGSVKLRLYKAYFNMVGNTGFWIVMAFIVIAARSLEIGESWWIKTWAESYNHYSNETNTFNPDILMTQQFTSMKKPVHDTPSDGQHNLHFYLGVYALITCSNVITGSLRYALLYWGVLGANRKLYAELVHRIFRAPLRFFDTTPMGRILNRFSKDFEAVDSRIPTDLMAFVIQWFMIFTTAITASVVIPPFVVPIVIVAIINVYIGVNYVISSRELKRLDSVSRSPVFSNFTETIAGVATIRAYGVTQGFLQTMMECVDANVRPFFYAQTVTRWVSLRYSLTSAAINLIACACTLYLMDTIDVALAGFGLSYVLLFTDNMFWGIRQYTGLEMSFNSVERIIEYTEIDQEADAITNLRPPPQWPTHGKIEVKNLEVRYAADLDPVLRGLSFSVKSQEKIGVVGRTGSGKSTLALSFFRFVEASQGSIVIDNIDIKHIGTEDLRSNLTIIPQDPTLFSGSLRSNLDPFNEFQDQNIFNALRRVHLIPANDSQINEEEVNINVFKDLETNVSEGGKNFSQGQRQLLCLARALLKSSRVVLMDEATASVDFETDKAIQKTISTEFSNSTILCIAHRLHTVIEYDRILLLDHGKIIEFDNPLTLMNDLESSFYKMCRKSGEFDSLMELAKSKHQLVDT